MDVYSLKAWLNVDMVSGAALLAASLRAASAAAATMAATATYDQRTDGDAGNLIAV